MKTDVFPVEDSVRVVWSRACRDCEMEWQIKSRSKRADQARFSGSVHGPACSVDYMVQCDGLDERLELPLHSYSQDQMYGCVYRAGLFGHPYPYEWPTDGRLTAAYDLGRDEAQLIDWQK